MSERWTSNAGYVDTRKGDKSVTCARDRHDKGEDRVKKAPNGLGRR